MSEKERDPEPLPNEPPAELQRAQEERLAKTWETPSGWRYWSTVNNTTVGVWYTATTFIFFLFGGVLAVLMRIQLAVPGEHVPLRRALQPGLHRPRLGDDVSFRDPGFRIDRGHLPPADARRARPAVPGPVVVWLLVLSSRRTFSFRLDFVQRRARRRLVHVSAAHLRLSAGDRRRYVAARLFLHRGGGDRGGGGIDRRDLEMPAAGDAD